MSLGSAGRQTRGSRGRNSRRSSKTVADVIVNRFRLLLNPRILMAIVALWAIYEGVLSQHSLLNLYKFRQERNQLKQQLAEAQAKRDDLKRRIELLETDSFEIERLARENLGFAKKGEIIYRYEEPAPEDPEEVPLTPPIVDEGEEKPDQ